MVRNVVCQVQIAESCGDGISLKSFINAECVVCANQFRQERLGRSKRPKTAETPENRPNARERCAWSGRGTEWLSQTHCFNISRQNRPSGTLTPPLLASTRTCSHNLPCYYVGMRRRNFWWGSTHPRLISNDTCGNYFTPFRWFLAQKERRFIHRNRLKKVLICWVFIENPETFQQCSSSSLKPFGYLL